MTSTILDQGKFKVWPNISRNLEAKARPEASRYLNRYPGLTVVRDILLQCEIQKGLERRVCEILRLTEQEHQDRLWLVCSAHT